jgi:hypothetical protein
MPKELRILGQQPRRLVILSCLRITHRHRWPAVTGYQAPLWPSARLNRSRGLHEHVGGPQWTLIGPLA